MLIHTRPRCNLSEPDRATNAPHPHPEEWTVRVTGTDGVEVAAAAFKAGAQLCQTRRGWNWFRCTPAALAVLREDHVVALADIATWAALVRPPTAEDGEPNHDGAADDTGDGGGRGGDADGAAGAGDGNTPVPPDPLASP